METKRMQVAEEDDTQEIEVTLGTAYSTKIADEYDRFAENADDLRKLDGLSPAFKRKATREVNKAMRGEGDARTKRNERFEITGYNLFEVIMPPYNLYYLAALYEKSSPHAAAVKAKVRNIVGLGYDWVETDKTKEIVARAENNEKKLDSIRRKLARGRRDLTEWLDNTNQELEFQEVLQNVWTDYETTGNGYIEIGRKSNGQIGYIGHIPSTTMRVRRRRDGFVQLIANRAVFFRNFGDSVTPDTIGNDPRPNEIIHLKKYTPTNGYYGVPDILAALNALVGNEFAARYNLDYFENKAVPRYVIVVKGGNLSPNAEKRVMEFFQSSLKGVNHRSLYVPLPADEDNKKISFEMKPVEAGRQDSSFNEYRIGNINEILMAHGVPINKVSISEGDTTLAAARDADKTFKEQVCRPEQRILDKKLNKIIKELTDVFVIKLNELSLTDEAAQATVDETYLRLGVILPNEVRARKGLAALPHGNDPVALTGQQAAEQRAQASGNRQRDQQRQQNSTDSQSSTNTRAEQGAGRQQG